MKEKADTGRRKATRKKERERESKRGETHRTDTKEGHSNVKTAL
jgi:hypothetical protein